MIRNKFKFTNEELQNTANPRWQAYWDQFQNVPSLRKAFRAAALRLHTNKQSTLPDSVFKRHSNLYHGRLTQLESRRTPSPPPPPRRNSPPRPRPPPPTPPPAHTRFPPLNTPVRVYMGYSGVPDRVKVEIERGLVLRNSVRDVFAFALTNRREIETRGRVSLQQGFAVDAGVRRFSSPTARGALAPLWSVANIWDPKHRPVVTLILRSPHENKAGYFIPPPSPTPKPRQTTTNNTEVLRSQLRIFGLSTNGPRNVLEARLANFRRKMQARTNNKNAEAAQLRNRLARRGLSTSGSYSTLRARLANHEQREHQRQKEASRKRPRPNYTPMNVNNNSVSSKRRF